MPATHRADRDVATVAGQEVILAPFGGRLIARLVDAVIIGLPLLLVSLGFPQTGTVTKAALFAAVWIVYETFCRARTPGKRLVRLKVVRVDNGEQPGLAMVFIRSLIAS